MAGTLQGDQRALLQLLYERGQSYDDISGLLGVPPDEVRERARAALETIGGADPDADVPLTDFLLGKADPIGRADAIRHLQADPGSLALAESIQAGLTLIAPEAKPAKLPEPRGKTRKAAIPATPTPPSTGEDPTPPPPSEPELGSSGFATSPRSRLIAILTGAGLIVIVVILAIAGVFGGGDSDGGDATTDTTQAEAGGEAGQRDITSVDLRPVDGSGVAGTASFGLIDEQQLVVDLDVQGLNPNPPEGSAYLLWLVIGSQAGYPVSTPLQPDDNGSFQNRIVVPTEVAVTFGSQASAVRISETKLAELRQEVRTATEQEVPILPFVGTDLASGEIPLVRGADRGAGNRGSGSGQGTEGG